MSITKKLLAAAATVYCLSGAYAYANELNIDLNLGGPAPVYAEPAPVIVAPSPGYVGAHWSGYDPHHRHHDHMYWRQSHYHPEHRR